MTEVKTIPAALSAFLASSYTLYLKTQNYHWNVTGPNFHSLHIMFEEQYIDLSGAVDELAEHIRALGARAPGSFKEYSALTSISEASDNIDAMTMVKHLHADHVQMAKAVHEICEQFGDKLAESTQDLLTDRERAHQKAAWMLSATLG